MMTSMSDHGNAQRVDTKDLDLPIERTAPPVITPKTETPE